MGAASMTPLLEMSVRVLAEWHQPWNAEAIGISSPQGLLSAISAAKVFVIEEAETDTTIARDIQPGYFATTTGFYLPAPVCWYEYKAYGPGPDGRLIDMCQRSAFLAMADETDGIVVFFVSQIPGGWAVMPGFGFDKALERSPVVIEGQPINVRLPEAQAHHLTHEGLTTSSNFFLELVELVNMPTGVIRTDEPPNRAFRRRLAAAMGRIDFDLQPVTHVALDLGDLHRRAVGGRA